MLGTLIRDWLENVSEQRSTQLVLDQKIVLATDVGLQRNENQDRVAALQFTPNNSTMRPFICVAVSDGMGGMLNGAECATITIAELFSSLISNAEVSADAKLRTAASHSNEAVYQFAKGKGGATLSAVLVENDGSAYYLNVGDSRIYVVPNDRSDIVRATIDDTLHEAFGGQSRELVQFVGIGRVMLPRIDRLPRDARSVFITSDGAHYFDPSIFKQIILEADTVRRGSERIIAIARWLGGPDNASIAAFHPSEILSKLTQKPGSVATIWSGGGELQLAYAPQQVAYGGGASEAPPPPIESASEASSSEIDSKRKQSRSRRKASKEKSSTKQLEIKIESGENNDDADS
ncbi:hypothetical protein GPL21_33615 [Bradyrhizobium pachyrhizi]|uniref:PPM-type phosphatase domain-containing protein n=1 Tax=Bradyrhizobium pachyrhizi TaxID=280333 RepID=A0A844T1R8_9BRAD|nr:protein phosphatase 2C domain-containing protein [Bradyrhizobium pachyrhizi]MVT70024.1 hypothetical protein [Bradyrhizobium pachyrhizi]